MELAVIGLGRMGLGILERLVRAGHRVVGYDTDEEARRRAEQAGGDSAATVDLLVHSISTPRVIWMMIPAGQPVDDMINRLVPELSNGDILVDGGNSNYKDSVRRAEFLSGRSVEYVDAGTSGGVWGLNEGFSLMVGGRKEVIETIRPALESLAPAKDRGWGHVGPSGAGHFVKMVHNGIEYGLMQAYAEGFAIMNKKSEFDLDLRQIAGVWSRGSVVRSWLLDLIGSALAEDSSLQDIAPFVQDSGMGRWTLQEAIDLEIPAPVITSSVLQRLRSRDQEAFYDRLLAAMRNQFGGHIMKKTAE